MPTQTLSIWLLIALGVIAALALAFALFNLATPDPENQVERNFEPSPDADLDPRDGPA